MSIRRSFNLQWPHWGDLQCSFWHLFHLLSVAPELATYAGLAVRGTRVGVSELALVPVGAACRPRIATQNDRVGRASRGAPWRNSCDQRVQRAGV